MRVSVGVGPFRIYSGGGRRRSRYYGNCGIHHRSSYNAQHCRGCQAATARAARVTAARQAQRAADSVARAEWAAANPVRSRVTRTVVYVLIAAAVIGGVASYANQATGTSSPTATTTGLVCTVDGVTFSITTDETCAQAYAAYDGAQ